MWKLAMLMEWSSTYHFCSRKEWLHATRVISHVLRTRPVVRGDMTEYICLVHFRCDAPNALLAVNNRPS